MVSGVAWSPAIISSDTVHATIGVGVTSITGDSLMNIHINYKSLKLQKNVLVLSQGVAQGYAAANRWHKPTDNVTTFVSNAIQVSRRALPCLQVPTLSSLGPLIRIVILTATVWPSESTLT